jgi:polyphosphate glucokinase
MRGMGQRSLCAGGRFRRSESEGKNRPAPFEMTGWKRHDARICLLIEERKPYPLGANGATDMKSSQAAKSVQAGKTHKVLVIDVGGTNIKMLATGEKEARKIPSGPTMTASKMVRVVKECVRDWKFDRVSLGYPGPIINGHPLREPHNLGGGWMKFDFSKAFGCPVKVLNDAAMQALGSYKGGRMLFLGLGTGLGSAMIVNGVLEPMELAHLAYKKGKTYEDYLGLRGLERLGKKKWRRCVAKVTENLRVALEADYVVLGGGNSKKLKKVPDGAQLGNNENAFLGGFRMWEK